MVNDLKLCALFILSVVINLFSIEKKWKNIKTSLLLYLAETFESFWVGLSTFASVAALSVKFIICSPHREKILNMKI